MLVDFCFEYMFFCVILRHPPISTLTDTLFPYTTRVRSGQRRGIRSVRGGAELRVSAGRARAPGGGRGTGAELRTGADDEPVSGGSAQRRPRPLRDDLRPRFGARAAARRRAGRCVGLECGLWVSGAAGGNRPGVPDRPAGAPGPAGAADVRRGTGERRGGKGGVSTCRFRW